MGFAFRCERFPHGVAHIRTDGGAVVDFVDGNATVSDPAMAAALRKVPPVFEIVEIGGAPESVPDGSVAIVLAWVGGDADRARLALTAERERAEPRSTLVTKLTALIPADE